MWFRVGGHYKKSSTAAHINLLGLSSTSSPVKYCQWNKGVHETIDLILDSAVDQNSSPWDFKVDFQEWPQVLNEWPKKKRLESIQQNREHFQVKQPKREMQF